MDARASIQLGINGKDDKYWNLLSNIYNNGTHYIETPLFDSSYLTLSYNYSFILPPHSEIIIGKKVSPELKTAIVEGQTWDIGDYFNIQYSISYVDELTLELPLVLPKYQETGLLKSRIGLSISKTQN